MYRHLTPPGRAETVPARRALVLAPHYDDEVLGCGGLVRDLTSRGGEASVDVRVLFLTDGRGTAAESGEDVDAHVARRREEAASACEVLGVAGFDELLLPDGGLDQRLDELEAALRDALLEHRPDLLLAPSPLEVSVDHRATFTALHRLLGGLRQDAAEDDHDAVELFRVASELRVLLWEANRPLFPDVLVDVGEHLDAIERAMACHVSQEALHPYLQAALGMRRYRAFTLGPGAEAAEAYRSLRLDDFRTRGPAALVAHLGGHSDLVVTGDGPLVSVVVRTKDRSELLRQALASLARQTWRRLEVVLVNDGGAPPELGALEDLDVRRVELPENQGRAAAANAGVEAARGDYFGFLDDDDLLEPDHVETLARAVTAEGVRVAYSDAAVSVLELQPETGSRGWTETERRLPYSRDFDADLLLLDNYLPFNTLVLERSLFGQAGPFDTGLPFFEDWDFLLRVARITPFHHVRRVTCEYRNFRGAGHHVLGDLPRQRADFLDLKAKVIGRHLERLEPEERARAIARVVDRLRAETVAAEEAARTQATRREDEERRVHELHGALDSLRKHLAVLEGVDERRSAELTDERRRTADLESQLRARDGELRAAYDELGRLDALVREMESTRAWRLHQKLQSWKG